MLMYAIWQVDITNNEAVAKGRLHQTQLKITSDYLSV